MKSTMMKTTLGLLMLGGFGLAAPGATAGWDRDQYDRHAFRQSQRFSQQIDARQDRQMDRILTGMQEGRLTRSEFRELMHEQHRIRAMERHFTADGFLDAREFRRLDHALDLASHNIRTEKHDRQERYAYNASPWQD